MNNNYLERGHSLTTKRGNNVSGMIHRIFTEDHYSVWKEIDQWRKDHAAFVTVEWWKQVWADFQDDGEDILEYLEGLCDRCITEKPGCECEQHFSEYGGK